MCLIFFQFTEIVTIECISFYSNIMPLFFSYLFLGPGAGGKLVHECTKKATPGSPRNLPPDFLGSEDSPENNASRR